MFPLLACLLDRAVVPSLRYRRKRVTDKPIVKVPDKSVKIIHPGMMGDGTEERNLNEPGDPSIRINADEVDAAFGKDEPKKP